MSFAVFLAYVTPIDSRKTLKSDNFRCRSVRCDLQRSSVHSTMSVMINNIYPTRISIGAGGGFAVIVVFTLKSLIDQFYTKIRESRTSLKDSA